MSKPQAYEGTRTEIALAQAVAAQRKAEGWLVVRAGDIAKLRAAGENVEALYDLASFPTAILYADHGEGRFKGIAFEVWRRAKGKRALGIVPPDQVDLLGAQS
jgi:hypothetical protein